MTPGMTALVAAFGESSLEESWETAPATGRDMGDSLAGAQSSLAEGCHQDAAILAERVLQDAMRRLCHRNEVALPKQPTVEGMNTELARKGIYDDVVEERLRWMAELCEQARMGLWSEFSPADVEAMLEQIQEFVVQYPA